MRRWFALILIVVAGLSLVAFFAWNRIPPSEPAPPDALTVKAQQASTSVQVDSVVMPVVGYVVVRGVENSRLGQIIEISDHLAAGRHAGINIGLGDFYSGGQELIVLIYADNGDNVFNDNDKPYTDPAGVIIGRYVATGMPVPQNILKANSVTAGHVMGGTPMIQIRYTDEGFQPATVEVSIGTMVEFVNESSKDMWVASNEHPEHGLLPTFDEFESVSKSGSYTYVFDKKGTWPYHDHINPAVEGVVVVK